MIEARDNKNWSKLANDCALLPPPQLPQLCAVLMQVQHASALLATTCIKWTVQVRSVFLLYLELSPNITVSRKATMDSWDIDYVGNDLLYDHIKYYAANDSKFARYTLIVQSSGMGKSRTIDELCKKHLIVPLNLREDTNGDF